MDGHFCGIKTILFLLLDCLLWSLGWSRPWPDHWPGTALEPSSGAAHSTSSDNFTY